MAGERTMSDVMSAVPEDHPLMKAWKVHQTTADFANSKRWAAVPEHLQGSLWALFYAGYHAALTEGRRQGLEEAAKIVAEAQAEVQENIDQNVMEVGVMQIKPSDNWPLIRARDWLRACHENIVALAKGPKA